MTKFSRLVSATCIAFTLHFTAHSQSVSINTDGSTAHASALLDVKSTAKGVLVPRMSKTERNAIASPATGLMVFQNAPDSVGFYYYDGTSWLWLATASASAGWLTTGNAGINPTNNFLGTTDANSLRFRYNNIFAGQINDTSTFLGYKAGLTNPALAHNIGIGPSALQNNSTTYNIAIGDSALYGNTAGGVIGIGHRALSMNANYDNIALGYNALDSNGTGYRNVAIGNHALRSNKTGYVNTAIGFLALANNTGAFNVAVGDFNLANNTTGNGNTAIGSNVLDYSTTGVTNTAVGTNSMFNNIAGSNNTAIGYQTLLTNDSTSGNTAVGQWAMYSHIKNANNTAIGLESMEYDSAGSLNTAVGWRSLRNNKSGVENVALGTGALETTSTGSYNIAIGRSAGFYTDTVNFTTSVGHSAGAYNKRERITAIGAYAGYANSYSSTNVDQGKENTMVGYAAMTGNAFGSQNTAVGYKTMATYEPGSYSGNAPMRNVGVGDSALFLLRGNDNVAIGFRALSKSGAGNNQSVAVGSRALLNATTGYPNTAIGYSSQDSATTGAANTSVGAYALMSNKIGVNNTAIGNAAMMEAFNPAGASYPFDNTAVGNDALRLTRYYGETALGAGALRNDTGSAYNTALGYLAMYYHLRGSSNTAVGTSALRNDTTGNVNTALGVNTLYNHRNGDNNVAIGYDALFNDIDGGANTAVGTYSMVNHKTNGLNTAIGYESMYYDTAGSYNAAMGYRSLRYVKQGYENTALGVGTIEFSDSSYYNTAVGRGAMIAKGGKWNTVVGYFASGEYSGIGTTNYYMNQATIVGAYAGFRNTGDQNTFVGYYSGFGATDTLTGIENTGLGTYTLTGTTTGKSNTALGMGTLYNNISGSGNVAIGTRSLANATSYNYNIAIGDSAMYGNNANENMAIGTFAMRFNNTGTANSAVGNYAMQNNSTGSNSTALGYQALVNSNANGNTAIGYTSGNNNTTGTFNTLFGYNTDVSATGLTNASAIGSNALVAQSNSMVLGSINGVNGATSDTKVGIGTTTPDSLFSVTDNFMVNSSGELQYSNPSKNMIYMFQSGTLNADRMVIAHSPANTTWGLQYQDANDRFNFLAGGAAVLTADLGSSRVGVGTTTPSKKFHVFAGTSGASTNASTQMLMEDNTNSYFEMSTPNANENGILSSNTTGIRSAVIFANDSSIRLRTGGNTTRVFLDNNGFDGFNRTPTSGTNVGTIQISNASSGDDILGLYNVGNSNRWTFWHSTDLDIYYNGNFRGAFNNATGTYTPVSDKRMKKDFTDFNYDLKTVMALQPYKYRYLDNKSTDPLIVGFMAQDVLKIFPEAVYRNFDKQGKEFYTMDYQAFSVLSIKAIQQQQQQIDELKKQNELLIKRIEKLENK